jgi:hypothetical protein
VQLPSAEIHLHQSAANGNRSVPQSRLWTNPPEPVIFPIWPAIRSGSRHRRPSIFREPPLLLPAYSGCFSHKVDSSIAHVHSERLDWAEINPSSVKE